MYMQVLWPCIHFECKLLSTRQNVYKVKQESLERVCVFVEIQNFAKKKRDV